MNNKKLIDLFEKEKTLNFAYLFGSVARGDAGPLSDLDIAVYLNDEEDYFSRKLQLTEAIMRTLGINQLDLVILNDAPIVLKFAVIKDGILLKDNKPAERKYFETKVIREYLDTAYLRSEQRRIIREQVAKGNHIG